MRQLEPFKPGCTTSGTPQDQCRNQLCARKASAYYRCFGCCWAFSVVELVLVRDVFKWP